MKRSKILASMVATVLALGAGAVCAQGQQGGGQQGGQQGSSQQQMQQQQRQAERAMSQDRVMDQERLQTRERDRTQDQAQTQTQTQTQAQTQTKASAGGGEGIYGGNLMTVQERNRYRAELGGLQDEQQRKEYEARHREQMQLRAKERGIEPEVTTD
jgi:hypothetical protein